MIPQRQWQRCAAIVVNGAELIVRRQPGLPAMQTQALVLIGVTGYMPAMLATGYDASR